MVSCHTTGELYQHPKELKEEYRLKLFFYQSIQFFLFYTLLILFGLRSHAEMGHTCRGTINLATANIVVEDSCNFVISNGGAQTYHLKASSEIERQRWITALELAKAKAVSMQAESGRKEAIHIDTFARHF